MCAQKYIKSKYFCTSSDDIIKDKNCTKKLIEINKTNLLSSLKTSFKKRC